MAERDANKEALEQVETATESESVKGFRSWVRQYESAPTPIRLKREWESLDDQPLLEK